MKRAVALIEDLDGAKILEGEVYDFAELDRIDDREAPAGSIEEMEIIGSSTDNDWDVNTMMVMGGM